jgi:UDP-3-O-[3-hydroxymyristoyl] N-acetylglucosamine deacetylase/3-hydroxyacyl-[acyl-carrier-protein] dehydratase
MSLSKTSVVGVKNVTMNEYWFQGHFPDEPIMPGVLIVEAMAQTGGILCLKTYPDPENYQTYFLKMNDVKFKQKVVPGDTCVFKLDLIEPVRRGMCHMLGRTYVNGKLVAEADMLARLVKVRGLDVPKTESQLA